MWSKALQLEDYGRLAWGVAAYDAAMVDERLPVAPTAHHQHRRWETAIILDAMREVGGIKTVAEIGSGGSPTAYALAACGYEVTCIDPSPLVLYTGDQDVYPITVIQDDALRLDMDRYDAVLSLSVLEHVRDDVDLWDRMLDRARSFVGITVDFTLDGRQCSAAHLRTYSPYSLAMLAGRGKPHGWHVVGEPDWGDYGPHVFDYSFASLCMERMAA